MNYGNVEMAHSSDSTNQNIRESISCAIGMESLIGQKYELHVRCPSCMIGIATLDDSPSLKSKVVPPFYQLNMDSFSSSVKSVEGYLHAVVLIDNQTASRGTEERTPTRMVLFWPRKFYLENYDVS